MDKILIVENYSPSITVEMLRCLAAKAEPIIIRAGRYLDETKPTNFTPEREHGWYRKFEKNGKKRNFKKAI